MAQLKMEVDIVCINKEDGTLITADEFIEELKKAIIADDKPGIRLLQGIIRDMGAKDQCPELFL